jgi:CrcB protein
MYDDERPAPVGRDPAPIHLLPVDPDVTVGTHEAARARSLPFLRQARHTLGRRWDILLVIAAGGALGSLARWGLGEALSPRRGHFPWATFLENVTGGFALGMLMVFVVDVWPPSRYVRPFIGVGVLGGFTTFSTYLLDTRTLVVAHRVPLAAVYLFSTLAAGIAGVWLGIAVSRLLIARAIRRRKRRRRADGTRIAAETHPGAHMGRQL